MKSSPYFFIFSSSVECLFRFTQVLQVFYFLLSETQVGQEYKYYVFYGFFFFLAVSADLFLFYFPFWMFCLFSSLLLFFFCFCFCFHVHLFIYSFIITLLFFLVQRKRGMKAISFSLGLSAVLHRRY